MKRPGSESGFTPEIKQQNTYEILANAETREQLKERMLRFVKTVHERHVDSMVFLDRSARPLSWMFQDLWDGMYKEEKRPEIKYVNIGTSSHVHKGVSDMLQTAYFGAYSDAESIQNKIVESEETDEWFTTKEIPKSWQRSMIEHAEVVNELQSIFGKVFDGKSLLIVDEMMGQGKTLMAAAGFFALAFPQTKEVEATGLFYSRQYHSRDRVFTDMTEDKKIIPWLQELGMAGVLELPDESLLSGTITKEQTQKILPIVQTKIKELERDIAMYASKEDQADLEKNLERKDLYEHPEKMIQRARQLRKELKQLASDALREKSEK